MNLLIKSKHLKCCNGFVFTVYPPQIKFSCYVKLFYLEKKKKIVMATLSILWYSSCTDFSTCTTEHHMKNINQLLLLWVNNVK